VLASAKVVAFVATTDPARAKGFYGGVLGLTLVSEDNFALVFDAHGTTLRVSIVPEIVLAPYTVLGWNVADLAAAARDLAQAGVQFERYPWMQQDEPGVWSAPGGAQVAWFKDADGNVLSLSQL
jgi:catechol 2,3-dioxygenase-like lactoylglutathione lyase family enzyme